MSDKTACRPRLRNYGEKLLKDLKAEIEFYDEKTDKDMSKFKTQGRVTQGQIISVALEKLQDEGILNE